MDSKSIGPVRHALRFLGDGRRLGNSYEVSVRSVDEATSVAQVLEALPGFVPLDLSASVIQRPRARQTYTFEDEV